MSPISQPRARFSRKSRKTPEILRQYGNFLPFDLRLLGVSPFDGFSLRDKPFDAVVASPNRVAPADLSSDGDGIVVTYNRPSGTTIAQTYRPVGKHHVLVRLQLESPTKHIVKMNCTYSTESQTSFPFPDVIELAQFRGDLMELEERSTLRVESINVPIPPSIFQIESVGLASGTPVIGSALPPNLIKEFHHVEWDGKKLVLVRNTPRGTDAPLGIRSKGSPLPKDTGVGGRRRGQYAWMVGGSVLLLISAVAFWFYRRGIAPA